MGNIDLIKSMILSEEDTDFALSDITYKTLVTQMWQRFVDEYRELVRAYYLSSIQTQSEETKLKELKINLEKQSSVLTSQKWNEKNSLKSLNDKKRSI